MTDFPLTDPWSPDELQRALLWRAQLAQRQQYRYDLEVALMGDEAARAANYRCYRPMLDRALDRQLDRGEEPGDWESVPPSNQDVNV